VFKRFWLNKKLMLFSIDTIFNRKSHVGVSIEHKTFLAYKTISGVKHHNPNPNFAKSQLIIRLFSMQTEFCF